MSYRKTSLEIDESLFAAAQRTLGTGTLRETVEEAFREVLRAEARREEVRVLSSMEGLDLADPEIMSKAWRS
jgi:Arc/MetJ family transcription regulator